MVAFCVYTEIMRTPDFTAGDRLDFSYKARISDHNAPQAQGGGKRFTFVISTGDEDRHGTRIMPEGLDYSDFMNNPVVLFNHDYDKIVGRCIKVEVKGGRVIAEMEFDDENPFAMEKKGQVERGFLNATSIGFIVKGWTMDEENDQFIITESELVEFSIVSVPSNRNALVLSRDLKDLEEIKAGYQRLDAQISRLTDMVSELRKPEPEQTEDARKAESYGDEESPTTPEAEQEATPERGAETPQPAKEETSDDSAIHDAEANADSQSATVPRIHNHSKARIATQSDYQKVIEQMIPEIRKNVRRYLGRE